MILVRRLWFRKMDDLPAEPSADPRGPSVLIVGNTNNYPMVLAFGLVRLGARVEVVVDRPEELHRPESRYSFSALTDRDSPALLRTEYPIDPISYLLPWRFYGLRKKIRDADLIVANGLGIGLVSRHARKTFCVLTGSDLEWYCSVAFPRDAAMDPERSRLNQIGLQALLWLVVRRQRRCVTRCLGFNYFPEGVVERGDSILRSLCPRGHRTSFMLSDGGLRRLERKKGSSRFRVLGLSRISLRDEPSSPGESHLDLKRTDLLLDGFADFVKLVNESCELILTRKFNSNEMPILKELVEERIRLLGIDGLVTWRDESTVADFLELCSEVDVGVDQLGQGSIGMATLDCLAVGTPVIANLRPEVVTQRKAASGIFHATTAKDVCEVLLRLFSTRFDSSKTEVELPEWADPVQAAKEVLELWQMTEGAQINSVSSQT